MSKVRGSLRTAAVVVTAICSGCAIFRPVTIGGDHPTSLSLDAKQRMVIAVRRPDKSGVPDRLVVCAEPSPDALQVLAASGGVNVVTQGPQIGGQANLSQAATGLGSRTQVIQLLRDGLYRACEAYMNRAIDEDDYHDIVRGYDEMMITLVALSPGAIGELPSVKAEVPSPSVGAGTQGGAMQPLPPAAGTAEPSATPSAPQSPPLTTASAEIIRYYYCYKLGLAGLEGRSRDEKPMTETQQKNYERVVNALCSDNRREQ